MTNKERLLNSCFGISLIYWGIAGFIAHYDGLNTALIRVFVTLLNMTVGLLIMFRKPVFNEGSLVSIIKSLPSLICGGLLFKLSKPLLIWQTPSMSLFIIGGSIALLSFLFLGRNFSIFPEIRGIVSHGFFRIIRHPSYFGECLMMLACLLSAESNISLLAFVIFVPSIMIRIHEEEQLLSTSLAYQLYQKQVKWRLIPFVW